MKEKDLIYNQSIKYLSRREHSSKEIKDKLNNKFPNQNNLIEKVIDLLIEKNFLSDERFTEIFIRNEILNLNGPNKIKQKLLLKGIEEDYINENLLQYKNEFTKNCSTLFEKKYKNKNLDFKEKQKSIRYLLNKGYFYEDIKTIFDNCFLD